MKFLDHPNYRLAKDIVLGLTFLMVMSIGCNTCAINNDMKTTKRVTKTLNENIVTKEDLDAQTERNLILEKELDKVKGDSVEQYLKSKKVAK